MSVTTRNAAGAEVTLPSTTTPDGELVHYKVPGIEPVTQGASVDLTFTGTSAQSGAITGTLIRLCATADCRVLLGSNPTALGTSMLLPAGAVEYLKITSGHKVAAIQESSGGDLNIMVCA